jgi:hypothetical protein
VAGTGRSVVASSTRSLSSTSPPSTRTASGTQALRSAGGSPTTVARQVRGH